MEKNRYRNGKKKINVVNIEMSKEDFKAKVVNSANMFCDHVKMVKIQYTEIQNLKENLPDGHVIAWLDFAENYTSSYYEEVQSTYWNKSMVTIHPIVVYYKASTGEITHKSFAMISDELSHSAAASFAFIQKLLPILNELVPNMSYIHYISDSPTSQYRNKFMFDAIAGHSETFNVPVSWHYFEAGHGKGSYDGVDAVVKRMADNAVKREKYVIHDAQGFLRGLHNKIPQYSMNGLTQK